MRKLLSSTKWFMLLSGIPIVILGVTMLFTPLKNLIALAIFIGISMLISGISEIFAFCGEEKYFRSSWMLIGGILTTLFGIWTIFGRGSAVLAAIMPFVFAVWVMSSGVTRIAGAISFRSQGYGQWGLILAFGIIGTALGFMLLFSPLLSSIIVAYAIAAMLIVHGLNNIMIFFCIKNIGGWVRKQVEW